MRRSAGAATGQAETGWIAPDVVSVREERQRLAGMLRAGVGFRVDGPEGRVGVLSGVIPDFGDRLPDRIRITTGLFLATSVDVPFGEVVSVDPFSRRVGIRVVPELPRTTRRHTARRVRRFLRTGGR